MTVVKIILSVFLLATVAGCNSGDSKSKVNGLLEQYRQLRDRNKRLELQNEQLEAENKTLEKQIHVLSALGAGKRLEDFARVSKIEISKRTAFYDKDRDGTKEKLIVYVRPTDEMADVIKAAGAIEVQLWDLNRPAGQALLGEWNIGPDELKKLWAATLMTTGYRLKFDKPGEADNAREELTVKVIFTDYLTGRVFTAQRTIKP